MTTHTPYDAEWQKLQTRDGMPAGYVETRAKREGYLRALADAQPRIDALVAALRALEWGQTRASFCPSCRNYQERGHEKTCQLAAALKLAGKE